MPATQYVNTTYSIQTTISAATVPPPPPPPSAATTTAKMAALYSPNIHLYEASILKLQNPTHKQTPGNPNFSSSQSKSKVGCYGAGAGAGARSSTALNPRILEIGRPRPRTRTRTRTSAAAVARAAVAEYKGDSEEEEEEVIFFDGGTHYGDLVANLVFGLSLLWLPLTVAAVFRAMFLRYRFTSLRVTVISGLTGSDRKDFSYASVKDVQVVPRLLGQWGDIVITLTDDSKVDLRSVPRFREIADYCLYKAEQARESANQSSSRPKGFL